MEWSAFDIGLDTSVYFTYLKDDAQETERPCFGLSAVSSQASNLMLKQPWLEVDIRIPPLLDSSGTPGLGLHSTTSHLDISVQETGIGTLGGINTDVTHCLTSAQVMFCHQID